MGVHEKNPRLKRPIDFPRNISHIYNILGNFSVLSREIPELSLDGFEIISIEVSFSSLGFSNIPLPFHIHAHKQLQNFGYFVGAKQNDEETKNDVHSVHQMEKHNKTGLQ